MEYSKFFGEVQLSEFRVLSPRTVRETGEIPQKYRMFQPVED